MIGSPLEILRPGFRREAGRLPLPNDPAVFKHIDAVCVGQGEGDVLLAEEHGDVGRLPKALERLRQTTEITVLLGEQNVTFALPHADRVYVLEHGRIVWEGDPSRFSAEAGAQYL